MSGCGCGTPSGHGQRTLNSATSLACSTNNNFATTFHITSQSVLSQSEAATSHSCCYICMCHMQSSVCCSCCFIMPCHAHLSSFHLRHSLQACKTQAVLAVSCPSHQWGMLGCYSSDHPLHGQLLRLKISNRDLADQWAEGEGRWWMASVQEPCTSLG